MNNRSNSGAPPERKPPKPKNRAGYKARFAHHTCWHHDWWSGCIGMSPEEVGIYERVIKLMYIRRAALHFDEKELAQLCHCDVRTFKRVLKQLIGRGRIVHDEETGLLYDERTIRELVKAGYFSEEQTARAMTRWNGVTPPRVIVDETARADLPPNVIPLNDASAISVAQVLDKVGAKLMETRVEDSGRTERDQSVRGENGHATQYPLPNTAPPERQNPEQGTSAPPSRRSPLNRGGAAVAPTQARDRQQWLRDQATALGVTTPGRDEAAIEATPEQTFQPGDKKAKRR